MLMRRQPKKELLGMESADCGGAFLAGADPHCGGCLPVLETDARKDFVHEEARPVPGFAARVTVWLAGREAERDVARCECQGFEPVSKHTLHALQGQQQVTDGPAPPPRCPPELLCQSTGEVRGGGQHAFRVLVTVVRLPAPFLWCRLSRDERTVSSSRLRSSQWVKIHKGDLCPGYHSCVDTGAALEGLPGPCVGLPWRHPGVHGWHLQESHP